MYILCTANHPKKNLIYVCNFDMEELRVTLEPYTTAEMVEIVIAL